MANNDSVPLQKKGRLISSEVSTANFGKLEREYLRQVFEGLVEENIIIKKRDTYNLAHDVFSDAKKNKIYLQNRKVIEKICTSAERLKKLNSIPVNSPSSEDEYDNSGNDFDDL